jgi:2-methylcitrate dehydratase PrpD
MTPAAVQVAEFALDLSFADLPERVRQAAKLHILDAVGCGLAAAASATATEGREVAALDGGAPVSTVIGLGSRLPAAAAAMANGMLCHGLDYDDTFAATGTHVSTVAGPAVLAVAELAGTGGEAALTAFAAAAEIVIALGLAAPFAMHRRGFHATSVYGVFGAAAATARLRGLDIRRTVRALGIAGSLASGIFEYLADGSPTKPIHAGWAAQAGIKAALLAERGASGPATVFEGRFGLFATYADLQETGLADSIRRLGTVWHTPDIAFKPYPSCHFMHGALDATRQAVGGRRLASGEVDSIVAGVPEDGVAFVLEPLADKRSPRTEYDAKFSLPFSVAAMLLDGELGVGTYVADRLRDARLLDLAAKVRYEVEPYPDSPDAFPGRVRIELADGRTLEADVPHQRGGPANPLTDADVREKFRSNAGLALPAGDLDRLEAALRGLEAVNDLAEALAPLAWAAPGVPHLPVERPG